MKEVTKEEFFKVIGSQDVHPQPQAEDRYRTSLFKTANGTVKGKLVTSDSYAIDAKSKFYLPESTDLTTL